MLESSSFHICSLMNENQAAELLGLSVKTLRNWRVQGKALSFVKLGRSVRYRRADLEKFINDRVRVSTSERPSYV